MNNEVLCPFSKPILGKWCQCQYARLAERCSGKMNCTRASDFMNSCKILDDEIRKNTRFILGVKDINADLTHAQLMKIRCGGLIGMSKVLHLGSDSIQIREIVEQTINTYNSLELFPYNEIVKDIRQFNHRK